MELNRNDYCDECWLIVSSENQEIPIIEAVTILTEDARSTDLNNPPQRVSLTDEAPGTVSDRIPTRVSGTGRAPGTILSNALLPNVSKTSKYTEPSCPLPNVKITRKSDTTLNNVKSFGFGGCVLSPKSSYHKRSQRRENSGVSAFTPHILSSATEALEGARPYDSDLCLQCLVDEYHNVFNKNILKNVCGSGTYRHTCNIVSVPKRDRERYMHVCSDPACPRFKCWKILDAGGAGWKVDTSFEGSVPPFGDVEESSYFVTSNGLCSKEQLVELSRVGFPPKIMDEIRPDIEVSEWFCGQSGCTSRYGFKVSLLDSHKLMKYVYGECKTLNQPEALEWRKVTYTFRDYDPGVRYVLFHHGGQGDGEGDTHPGSKMTGAKVIVKRPSVTD